MSPVDPLLLAFESLTKPVRSKVIQSSGDATKTVTVTLPPLLTQLEDAITGTVGIGGSGSLPSERNLLDADALQRFMTITATVRDWARMVKATITPGDTGFTLRAWYVGYRATPRGEASERFYTNQMTGWAEQIRVKLNPVRVREVPGECPTCGATSWWSKATREEYPFPLVTEYDPEAGATLVESARSSCRACGEVWKVRELAYLLEEREEDTVGA
jgi:hypothetical protein